MGDRGVIYFKEYGKTKAAIYTHWNGSDAKKVLIDFFQANEKASPADTRYDDAPYLAARFVAHVLKEDPYGTGWGIVSPTGPVDAQSFWTVDCNNLVGPERRPRVYREV
jgi:hypothetical protein